MALVGFRLLATILSPKSVDGPSGPNLFRCYVKSKVDVSLLKVTDVKQGLCSRSHSRVTVVVTRHRQVVRRRNCSARGVEKALDLFSSQCLDRTKSPLLTLRSPFRCSMVDEKSERSAFSHPGGVELSLFAVRQTVSRRVWRGRERQINGGGETLGRHTFTSHAPNVNGTGIDGSGLSAVPEN